MPVRASIAAVVCLLAQPLHAETTQFGVGEGQFSIEFVEIGIPGNPDDPRVLTLEDDDDTASFLERIPAGGLDYVYGMAKFEISLEIVEKVSEAANLGITFEGAYDRLIPGAKRAQSPALVSWTEAARVVNWLNTSQGSPAAYKFPFYPGDESFHLAHRNQFWDESEAGYDPENRFRNSLARYVLPTLDEWHKAAFYDPSKDDGQGGYWLYTTGSDDPPTAVASGTEPGTSVYGQIGTHGPADVDQAGGLSPYGLMGMGNNAREWMENTYDRKNASTSAARDWRSGKWSDSSPFPADYSNSGIGASQNNLGVGFRIVDLGLRENIAGDFNGDGIVTAIDIDLLSEQVVLMSGDQLFDVNDDGLVGELDRTFWVEDIANTRFGDADLNGTVNFADFLNLSNSFNQEAGWGNGDFSGDGTVGFADFLLLSVNFERGAAAAVPEPSALALFGLALCGLGALRKRRSA